MTKTFRTTIILMAALALPLAAHAQGSEAERLEQTLSALQAQAATHPPVQAAQDELRGELIAAMARIDPLAPDRLARAEALPAEVEAAQAAEDNARLHELAAEGHELQTYFAQLQPRAMQDEGVQEKHQAFTAALLERMREIDPDTDVHVQRLQELRAEEAEPGAR